MMICLHVSNSFRRRSLIAVSIRYNYYYFYLDYYAERVAHFPKKKKKWYDSHKSLHRAFAFVLKFFFVFLPPTVQRALIWIFGHAKYEYVLGSFLCGCVCVFAILLWVEHSTLCLGTWRVWEVPLRTIRWIQSFRWCTTTTKKIRFDFAIERFIHCKFDL